MIDKLKRAMTLAQHNGGKVVIFGDRDDSTFVLLSWPEYQKMAENQLFDEGNEVLLADEDLDDDQTAELNFGEVRGELTENNWPDIVDKALDEYEQGKFQPSATEVAMTDLQTDWAAFADHYDQAGANDFSPIGQVLENRATALAEDTVKDDWEKHRQLRSVYEASEDAVEDEERQYLEEVPF